MNFSLAFLAGMLTTLSPCVLPVLPTIVGSAAQSKKYGPLFLILGMMFSFVFFGFMLSRFGQFAGLDASDIRVISGAVLVLISASFFIEKVDIWISEKLTRFSNSASRLSRVQGTNGFAANFFVGSLLGAVWSPCAGPTLGVAISLASQQNEPLNALALMSVYALGSAVPMLAISYGLRNFFLKNKSSVLKLALNSKKLFGVILFVVGLMILLSIDKKIETWMLDNMPSSWVDLITKY